MPESSAKKLFYYALPAMPIALLGLPLYVYLPTFYTQNVGLGVFAVGVILFLARAFDMLLDPLLGYLSDRFFSRQKMMAVGAVILLGSFYALTHPMSQYSTLWLLLFSVLVYFGWSMINIPYLALSADISLSYHDNTILSSSREIVSILGVITALFLPYTLGISQEPQASLWVMNNVLFVLLPLTMFLFLYGIRDSSIKTQAKTIRKVFTDFYREISLSKRVFFAFFLNNFANAIPATLFLFYVELVIKRPDLTGILLILYFASGMLALPLWTALAKVMSKKSVWILSMMMASSFFAFVPFFGEGDVVYFGIITVLRGLSLGADMALPTSIQSDVARSMSREENNVSGTLFGFFSMLTKLSLAFGVGASFGILGFFDFDPKMPTVVSLHLLSYVYSLLPITLKLFSIAVLLGYEEDPH